MQLGLIGIGISHSQSPDLHQRLGQLTGLPTDYQLHDAKGIADFDLAATLKRLQAAGYRGVNITYPFKEQALALADELSADARSVGSTNTLLFEQDGRIRAENTDFTGFVSAYRHHFGTRSPGEVVQLGAGGVGRAVGHGLRQLGTSRLAIADPDAQRAQALAAGLAAAGLEARAIAMDELDGALARADGLVNCSFIGHRDHPGCPIDPRALQPGQWVFDAVYVPARTELLAAAEARGLGRLSGVELFIFQGLDAFSRFAASAQIDARLATLVEQIRHRYSDAAA